MRLGIRTPNFNTEVATDTFVREARRAHVPALPAPGKGKGKERPKGPAIGERQRWLYFISAC